MKENERIFNVEHLSDVRDLMKLGYKPFDVCLGHNNYIRFVFRDNEAYEIYQNIKAKRQAIRKTTK
ncbi:hypothetical protein GMB50_11740 [Turicibacter sanguinis]|uniref:hypothetical protein n=1 Tax=Turicibacter sanguinis TaxID=154288 RepID=UPI0012BBB659|nr:hypothetical protein [Turicibacter sanguinis]MDB8566251.1 hypothetical protein [Turicibacter sanguinis]MDB8568885.1 hypothetical protein [Turicibacter sanguinis]MDB8571752.1 hypothetical protein [Turicibacter sanguinis]MDB8580393.1 hypothetical protein [Turicibacter sanguinis]MTO10658.1 hypothetical protein [Turicibacter sanguinis]